MIQLDKKSEQNIIDILDNHSIKLEKDNKKVILKDIFIPPLPKAVSKILTFESNSSEGSQDLEKILLPDKALCTDILRVANSSFYGRNGSVETLHDAITLLGLKIIKNIAFIQARRNLWGSLFKFPSFKLYLYELPTLSSLICHDLLSILGKSKEYKEVFLMSSFSKIGINILALNFKEQYAKILDEYSSGERELVDLENELISFNNIEVTSFVLKEWKLPEVFIKIAENQGFGIDQIDNVSEINRIIRTGEILGKILYRIPIKDEELEILERMQFEYNLDKKLLELFSTEYFEYIQTHPFFSFF